MHTHVRMSVSANMYMNNTLVNEQFENNKRKTQCRLVCACVCVCVACIPQAVHVKTQRVTNMLCVRVCMGLISDEAVIGRFNAHMAVLGRFRPF